MAANILSRGSNYVTLTPVYQYHGPGPRLPKPWKFAASAFIYIRGVQPSGWSLGWNLVLQLALLVRKSGVWRNCGCRADGYTGLRTEDSGTDSHIRRKGQGNRKRYESQSGLQSGSLNSLLLSGLIGVVGLVGLTERFGMTTQFPSHSSWFCTDSEHSPAGKRQQCTILRRAQSTWSKGTQECESA